MKTTFFTTIGIVVVYAYGFATGTTLGFVWRGLYDAWFRRLYQRGMAWAKRTENSSTSRLAIESKPEFAARLKRIIAEKDAKIESIANDTRAYWTNHIARLTEKYDQEVFALTKALAEEKELHQLSGDAHMAVREICAEVGAQSAFVDDAVRQVVERLKAAESQPASSEL